MKGHQCVIAERMRKRSPRVAISSFHFECYGPDVGGIWVHVDPKENPYRLDLRFLNGLEVDIFAASPEWAEEMAQACLQAQASEVYIRG